MNNPDWIVIFCAAAIVIPIGIMSRKAASKSKAERFTASRQLPWYLLGGSLAATALSSDTPLLVSGAFYDNGMAGNWFWLAGIPGTLATLFFFARYWQRSGVLTEVEILSLRYGDTQASRCLRVTNAIFDAGFVNIFILASVTYAAHILVKSLFGFSSEPSLSLGPIAGSQADIVTLLLVATTATYTIIGGFRAVARTDMAQLVLALFGSVAVAYFALKAALSEHSWPDLLARVPNSLELFNLFRFDDASIALILLFGWLQHAPGSGIFVQRLVSARTEQEATLTALFFVVIHYVVRAWPWFAIGALGLVYFPNLTNGEQAFALVASEFMPIGGIGLLAIAFWAAFASTFDSRLNWAASYVVNDVYGIVRARRANAEESRWVETLTIVVMAGCSAWLALSGAITGIAGIYKYLLVVQSGAALISIARWYWWRTTVWAEIASLGSSFIVGNFLAFSIDLKTNLGFAAAMTLNTLISGAIALAVAVRTSRNGPTDSAIAFNTQIRVSGPGWKGPKLSQAFSDSANTLFQSGKYWLISIIFVYGCIALISSVLVANTPIAVVASVPVFGAGTWLWKGRHLLLQSMRFS